MALIQSALDRPMSQGSPEIFPDLFGQFFTSLAISEVCRPPHFRSKSGKKSIVKTKKSVKFRFSILKSLLRIVWPSGLFLRIAWDLSLLLNKFGSVPHLSKFFWGSLKASKHLIFSFFECLAVCIIFKICTRAAYGSIYFFLIVLWAQNFFKRIPL